MLRPGLKNQSLNIAKGDRYLYSHQWDENDPFQNLEIDTAIVLELSGDYVKWAFPQWKNGEYLSGELRFFKHNIREIKNEK